jgi:hypothetical protein
VNLVLVANEETSISVAAVNLPAAVTQNPVPFDFSSLRFMVHFVTSPDGRYREPEDDDEDDEDEDEYMDELEPWLTVSCTPSAVRIMIIFS